ncbi:hypothetical protein [Streptomyces marispadix]|uniref:Uncharacterized protein n=1 Tax=Streptomyces marispadix TaxID=2922868 RepID=A0ABS9T141_9ACTN|nr:hypothetical protein [Streptomyces marispadix]MCH6162255.1 hypothetical protein [Streptomyces marispadix]
MAADETPRSEPSDTSVQPSPHIRLRVDLVVEIADAEALTGSALERIANDDLMPDEERSHAEEIVASDAGEALACLVDPFDLVRELPGVELAHASWGSEEMTAAESESFSFLEGADGFDDADALEDGYADEAGNAESAVHDTADTADTATDGSDGDPYERPREVLQGHAGARR